MNKHIVIVEAISSGAGLEVVQSALQVGLDVTFLTKDLQRYVYSKHVEKLSQIYQLITVDTSSKQALTKTFADIHAKYPVDGIICLSDNYIELASELASYYKFPFISYDAVVIARNKDVTREFCKQKGFPIPRFQIVCDISSACKEATLLGYPCVLKASRGDGSSEVQLCRTEAEVVTIFPLLFERTQGMAGKVLLEEFVKGPLYSIEAITFEGQTTILGMTDRLLGNQPYFVEVGYSFPVSLDGPTSQIVSNMLIDLLRAMGVSYGTTHTEFILSERGPVIVEINPRLGGGLLGPMISESYDFDIYEQIIRVALGKTPEIPPKPVRGTSAYVVYPQTEGTLRLVDEQLARTYPSVKEVVIRANPGDKVKPPSDYRGDIGFLWATGPTAEMAANNCRTAVSAIQIEIE